MIKKIIRKINKRTTSNSNPFLNQLEKNKGRQIQFYNFWEQPYEQMFWYRFLTTRPELLNRNSKLKYAFFSVFGSRDIVDYVDADVKIFYSAENLKVDNYSTYSDHFLSSNKIDLSLGFEYFEHERYIRFPNWMDVFFLKAEEIKLVCNQLRYPNTENKSRFAACVASHGGKGLRDSIVDELNKINSVSCPGKFRHNDDSLGTQYKDNKMEYLKSFYFNICPENSNAMGYVTEKLFQSISVGCIPIYWGSYNKPELDVLNQDAIIFWTPDGDNTSAIKLIDELQSSPKLMKEFISQPRLLKNADEYIDCQMAKVEFELKKLITK
jgi:hypothetical protein